MVEVWLKGTIEVAVEGAAKVAVAQSLSPSALAVPRSLPFALSLLPYSSLALAPY